MGRWCRWWNRAPSWSPAWPSTPRALWSQVWSGPHITNEMAENTEFLTMLVVFFWPSKCTCIPFRTIHGFLLLGGEAVNYCRFFCGCKLHQLCSDVRNVTFSQVSCHLTVDRFLFQFKTITMFLLGHDFPLLKNDVLFQLDVATWGYLGSLVQVLRQRPLRHLRRGTTRKGGRHGNGHGLCPEEHLIHQQGAFWWAAAWWRWWSDISISTGPFCLSWIWSEVKKKQLIPFAVSKLHPNTALMWRQFSQEELTKAKAMLKGKMYRQADQDSELMQDMGQQLLLTGKCPGKTTEELGNDKDQAQRVAFWNIYILCI